MSCNIYINGIIYDLRHLESFELNISGIHPQTKKRKDYIVYVEFSDHCYTISYKKDNLLHSITQVIGKNNDRIFCVDRYSLSKKLPNIIGGLANSKCYHTRRGNFSVFEMIDNTSGKKVKYEIFFKIKKIKNKIIMTIQSAYIRDPSISNISISTPNKPIRFIIIVRNIFDNRPIKKPQ